MQNNGHANQPPAVPVVAHIQIALHPNGELSVQANVPNEVMIRGMCDMAKDFLVAKFRERTGQAVEVPQGQLRNRLLEG